jgi:acetyl-CoA carboxylase carboxyltransferase component
MSWQKDIDEINYRGELARQMGGAERVSKQHAKGRNTVRERIDLLLDKGTFQEIGTLAGDPVYEVDQLKSFIPSTNITGYGKLQGRPVCVRGEDFTVRSTYRTTITGNSKSLFIEKMSKEWRLPLIRLLDAPGGDIQKVEAQGYTDVPGCPGLPTAVALMAEVPVVSVALGSLAGLPAIMSAVSHWNIMTKNSQVFTGGPPIVKRALAVDITKEELGNYRIQAFQSGVIDNVAENEEDAFRQVKRFLSYLPQNVWEQPPHIESGDDPGRRDEALLSIIPRDRKVLYDIRKLIRHVVDRDSTFELAPFYGPEFVTLFVRMAGNPVAIMANDCKWYGGAQTTAGCEKMMRFIDLADTFHLPLIYFMDVPGFMVGVESEKEGIVRKSARALFALHQSTVPWVSVLLRRSHGVAGCGHGDMSRLNLRYAWPSGEFGGFPIEGGVMALHRREIETASDPEAKRIELENYVASLRSPIRTAEAFGVSELIDPRDTRPLLCEFVHRARQVTATQLGPKYRCGIRP